MLLQATETPTAYVSGLLYQHGAGVAKHAIQAKSPKYEGTSAHISSSVLHPPPCSALTFQAYLDFPPSWVPTLPSYQGFLSLKAGPATSLISLFDGEFSISSHTPPF